MKKNHNKQQKEHLLQSGNDNSVFSPFTHVYHIDDRLR